MREMFDVCCCVCFDGGWKNEYGSAEAGVSCAQFFWVSGTGVSVETPLPLCTQLSFLTKSLSDEKQQHRNDHANATTKGMVFMMELP